MSLRFKINLILIITFLSVTLSVTYFFLEKQKELIQLNIKDQAKAITTLVSDDLVKILYLNNPDLIADVGRQLQKIPNLKAAYFFDTQNKPLISIENPMPTSPENVISLDTPIHYQGLDLGHAYFIFDNKTFGKEKDKLNQFLLYTLILLPLLSLLFTHWFDHTFTARIQQLNDALKKTAEQKDFSLRLQPKGKDTLSEATQNFNRLIQMVDEKTRKLKYQAQHDTLTGLYNRNYLLQAIEHSLTSDQPYSLGYLDLDQFKVINDTCGHIAGDALLKDLSNRLNQFLAQIPNSLIGRIGGDEFIILIQHANRTEVETIFDALLNEIHNFRFTFYEHTYKVGASIGLIHYMPSPDINAIELLSAADAACYQAKEQGRDTIISYDFNQEGQLLLQQNMTLVAKITQALEQDRFKIYLQPITNAEPPHHTSHYEVLLRLQDEAGQFISPARFIPVAEQYGLAKQVDLWVLRHTLHLMTIHPQFVEQIHFLNINLSANLLADPQAIQLVEALLTESSIPYDKLCFEVTETGTLTSMENTQAFIKHFQQKGIKFALDDFGTGMASFHYLSELNVDILKIDGSFIDKMVNDPVMKELVETMADIGHITHCTVVAEKVENEVEIHLLQKMQVDKLQGYYFSAPKPFEHFANA